MAGDDADPAVPGYDPDISAELYTTNGDTDTHAHEALRHARLHAGDVDLRDGVGLRSRRRVGGRGLRQRLQLPRRRGADPGRVREEHPVRARRRASRRTTRTTRCRSSAATAAGLRRRPVRRLLRRPAAGRRDRQARARATCSSTTGSTAAATAVGAGRRVARRRALRRRERRLLRRVPRHGRGHAAGRRGRGLVHRRKRRHGAADRASEHFTYTRPQDTRQPTVLVLANEDYTGVNPTYPAGDDRAEVRSTSTSRARRRTAHAPTCGTSTPRACPHHLGVLSHYDAVVWYLGDNRLTQDPEDDADRHVRSGSSRTSRSPSAQQYLTIAVRDFLNEGGKLAPRRRDGRSTTAAGLGDAVGGIYYGLDGAPEEDCVGHVGPLRATACCWPTTSASTTSARHAHRRRRPGPRRPASRTRSPASTATFGGRRRRPTRSTRRASSRRPATCCRSASSRSSRAQGAAEYVTQGVDPFAPVEGTGTPARCTQDASYMRPARRRST